MAMAATSSATQMTMPEHLAPNLTLDLVLYVLRHTLLSPFVAAGLTFFTQYGQSYSKRILAGTDNLTPWLVYVGICVILWFLPWSSRLWENRSWRQGWRGLLNVDRIDWSEQIVLVTGGSQGLGKCIVDILDIKKVTVVVLDKRTPQAIPEYNDVHFYECDVSDRQQVFAVASKIRAEVGKPTVLVNNAGVVSGRGIFDLSERDVRLTFDVNTIAHFWLIQAFLPDMLSVGAGHVVNISSVLGSIGVNMMTDYCASKHAVLGMHESLRAELRQSRNQHKVKLTLVQPGHLRTTLFANMRPFNAFAAFLLPLQEPHSVAKAVVDRIEIQQGGCLCLPDLVGISWLWRGLPTWLGDFLRHVSQADTSMAGFHADQAKKSA